jgi:hypothetical protein
VDWVGENNPPDLISSTILPSGVNPPVVPPLPSDELPPNPPRPPPILSGRRRKAKRWPYSETTMMNTMARGMSEKMSPQNFGPFVLER